METIHTGVINECDIRRIRTLYSDITKRLIEKGLSITTMESCTAGLIASLLTDTEGSSAVMKGAFVTYSNEAKIMQGVPRETIEQYGVYSVRTAEEMAKACRRAYAADIGIGITGSMSNADPANPDSVPNEIFFALDIRGRVHGYRILSSPQTDRLHGKLAAAGAVAERLMELTELAD